jgi:hypothetical protein
MEPAGGATMNVEVVTVRRPFGFVVQRRKSDGRSEFWQLGRGWCAEGTRFHNHSQAELVAHALSVGLRPPDIAYVMVRGYEPSVIPR